MEKGRLTEKKHWEEVWDKAKLPSIVESGDKHPINKEILKVLDRFLPEGRLTAMEIGGAPGQFLAYLSKYRGYEAYAMDYSDIGCRKTKENFDALGLKITIYNRDFFDDLSDLPRFDLVFSMGFIEHFDDLEDVVQRHVGLLTKGGLLVLGVPNFGGFNGRILKRLAPKLLSMHNLEAMDARRWERFESAFGLEKLFLEYIGGFEPKNFRRCENKTWKNQAIRLFFKTVRTLATDPFPFLRNFNSPRWSAYLLGIYRSKSG